MTSVAPILTLAEPLVCHEVIYQIHKLKLFKAKNKNKKSMLN